MHVANSTFLSSKMLYMAFNQDSACFACGMQDGFRVYNADPLIEKERFEFEDGGIGLIEMLFRCNYLALVGGGQKPKYPPEEVVIWDDLRKTAVTEIQDFNEEVCSVRLRRDRIVVVLEHSVRVYSFVSPPQLLHTFETGPNRRGLCDLLATTSCALLAFPAVRQGTMRIVDLINPQGSCLEFVAHNSPLACLALNPDGTLLATASEKGTIIRVFSTAHGAKVHELRRGTHPAFVYCVRFNDDSSLLCAASSNGTVHIFSLKANWHSSSGFSNARIVRKVMGARPSFSRVPVPHVSKSRPVPFLCAFGQEPYSLIVICADGVYHKFTFNSKGANLRQQSADFLELNY